MCVAESAFPLVSTGLRLEPAQSQGNTVLGAKQSLYLTSFEPTVANYTYSCSHPASKLGFSSAFPGAVHTVGASTVSLLFKT